MCVLEEELDLGVHLGLDGVCGRRGANGEKAYVLYVALFFLVCLEYLEKVLVGIWVIGVACLYLVEVLDRVVELAGGLAVEGIPCAEAAEEGGCGGGGGDAQGEGVVGGDGAGGEGQRGGLLGEGDGGLGGGAGGGGDADGVRITWVGGDVNPVAGRKEGVEALYEGGVPVEEHGHAVDDAGRVDSGGVETGGRGGTGRLTLRS